MPSVSRCVVSGRAVAVGRNRTIVGTTPRYRRNARRFGWCDPARNGPNTPRPETERATSDCPAGAPGCRRRWAVGVSGHRHGTRCRLPLARFDGRVHPAPGGRAVRSGRAWGNRCVGHTARRTVRPPVRRGHSPRSACGPSVFLVVAAGLVVGQVLRVLSTVEFYRRSRASAPELFRRVPPS